MPFPAQESRNRGCTHPELCMALSVVDRDCQVLVGRVSLSPSRQLLGEQKVGFLKLARVQAGERARRAGFHRNGSWQNRQCEPWQG